MIPVELQADGKLARISDEGAVHVIAHPHPPLEEFERIIPFRQPVSDANGVSNMVSVGTLATPVEFCVDASETSERYIKTLDVSIQDGGAQLKRFGALPELTNGVEIVWSSTGHGEVILATNITTNYLMIRAAQGVPAFGSGADAFLAKDASAGDEIYFGVIDFNRLYGLPFGLRLVKGTQDKIIFRIRDDLTGIVSFTAFANGIEV